LREEDDGVSVGVAGRKVQRADVFAIQMNGHVMLEGNNRQIRLFSGLNLHLDGAAVSGRAAGLQSFPDVVLSNHGRAGIAEWRVSSGVVAVIVGINDEADGLVSNPEALE